MTQSTSSSKRGWVIGGVAIAVLVLQVTGLGGAMVANAAQKVQHVLITNKTLQVTVSNAPDVVAEPGAPSQPVQFSGHIDIKSASGDQTTTLYTVPSGKRLVIEYVSATYSQQFSDEYVDAGFSTGAGPTFFIPLSNESGRGTRFDFSWVGSEQTHLYAASGDKVIGHARHETIVALPASVDYAVSGYLVNSP